MIQKFLSKYGLSVHLAVLAALPLALTPFLTVATLGSVILWLSAFAAVWLFTEPSLRHGEHISTSRIRLRHEMFLDPFFWFFILVILYAFVRWLNAGIAMGYDVEQAMWLVRDPVWPGFPASTKECGFLPFCVSIAAALVVMGLRNAVGASARIAFGVTGSFLAGLGGLAAGVCACAQVNSFVEATKAGFEQAPFWASSFGVWLVIGVTSGATAEARKWAFARLPFIFGVAGNLAALVFFAPSLVALAWLVVAVLAFAFSLVAAKRESSAGAVTRCAVLAALGIAIPIILIMAFMPKVFMELKLANLNPTYVFSEAYKGLVEAMARISKKMWLSRPWFGVGEGAFALHVPFLAEKADWAVLPLKPEFAPNGYLMLLAERGIAGALLIAIGLGLQIASYAQRLVGGIRYHKQLDEGGLFVFSVPPVAWTLPLTIFLLLGEAWLSPILDSSTFILTAVVPLALSASSFPRERAVSASVDSEASSSSHHHSHSSEK